VRTAIASRATAPWGSASERRAPAWSDKDRLRGPRWRRRNAVVSRGWPRRAPGTSPAHGGPMWTKPSMNLAPWTLAAVAALGAACGGRAVDVGPGQGSGSGTGSGSGSGTTTGSGSGSGTDVGSGSGSGSGTAVGSGTSGNGDSCAGQAPSCPWCNGTVPADCTPSGWQCPPPPPCVEAPPDAGSDASAADLCAQTGGIVVQTFCSANPPFAQYTCTSGENGAICDPGPGENTPTTPECLCGSPGSTAQCFDPSKGCVASM